MNFLKRAKLLSNFILGFVAITTLTSCSTTGVQKKYNELDKKFSCRLEETFKRETFNGADIVKLVLEKSDNQKVLFLFSLVSFSYLNNMHADPKILFKIYSNDKITEELNFQATSRHWDKAYKSQSHSPYNLDYATVTIDKTTFEKIANAEKIEFFVQTNQDPARFILSKLDLKLFHKFMQTCY